MDHKNLCISLAHVFENLSTCRVIQILIAFILFYFLILFIYSWDTHTQTEREREREREAGTQAEGEAGSMQGAGRGTPSWVSRIMPRAEVVLNHWATRAAP